MAGMAGYIEGQTTIQWLVVRARCRIDRQSSYFDESGSAALERTAVRVFSGQHKCASARTAIATLH
jgi:hypothetical protein